MCDFISSVFKKTIPNNITLLFKKWVGYLYPAFFVDGIRTSHAIALNITKLIDFYSHDILLFCLALFSIEMNQAVDS